MSKFCRCYKACYAECRKDTGVYPCNVSCLEDCIKRPAAADQQLPTTARARRRPTSAADCNRICQSKSICGVMSTASTAVTAGDAEACLVDCRNSIGHSAPLKLNDAAN
ncbi:unnamed protein product [Miscanthus lutarioriparius]|uniref:Uncharacterized protein n=1 Tax=Miscanthus lutarioriparius TaxID=422564 RepID=A0A811PLN1_9POAL|nr:unnamed protein product [Miscanthus lutarioriparius]CAD6248380.1 unnamed protein product [Miscanthus lutarioriparius]